VRLEVDMRAMKGVGSWVVVLAIGWGAAGCQKEAGAGDAVTVAAEDTAPATSAPPTAPPAPTTEAPAPTEADAAPAAPEVAEAPDTAAAEAEALQEKIKALAVASECLRKQGVTPEQASQTMLALYRAHGIELDVYTREMGRLAGDPKFQESVQAALASCPAAPVPVEVEADAGGTVAEADAGATVAEADAGATVAEADAAPTTVAQPDAAATTVAQADAAPTVAAADAAPTTVAEADAGTPTPTPHEPTSKLTGTWTGALAGQGGGTLRMTVNGRNVTSAVATFGRDKITLKGSITEKGLVTLNGRKDNEFVRVKANVDKNQTSISGTWDGTIDKKKVGGKIKMTK